MAELTVDLTYSNALYRAAEDRDLVETILKEGFEILDIFHREKEFCNFFYNPTISAEEKKETLENIFSGKICDELLHFLCILVDKSRMRHYEKIMKSYQALVHQGEGIAYGKVYSVKMLTPAQKEKLENQTGKLMNQQVKLENQEDPSLIGGVKILIDGKIIDASMRKSLDDLGNAMKQRGGSK